MNKPNRTQLGLYQNHALTTILNHYDSSRDVTVALPAGSGKTLLAIYAMEELGKRQEVNRMLYVSHFNAAVDNFARLIEQDDTSGKVDVMTFNALNRILSEHQIKPNHYQVIIFDDIDLRLQEVSNLFHQVGGFKINFVRTEDGDVDKKFVYSDLYIYTLNQAFNDGYLVKSQELDLSQQIDLLKEEVAKITTGTDWSQAISDTIVRQIDQLKKKNTEYFKAQELLLSGKIQHDEIIEMSYRKEQLLEFKKLLDDKSYFDRQVVDGSATESVWQKYFERNHWIFGFGLNYVFNTALEGGGLERAVSGFSVTGHGKRSDALLSTTGIIRSLCFGEIKTHRKEILKKVNIPYRSESWSISDELAGGIAQVQRTIQKSLMNIAEALNLKDANGYSTKESIYLFKPKSFLIIGSLNEFKNAEGQVQEDKFSSFELFRRSISDLEIITFDELYQRADAIVNRKWNISNS
ncbi:Shedu anti-phage system protein SduA domain-containing protein [Mucilaginibacter pedocola]|nr:Shedu anti-phage system protein SduA domain-containing protein [Mucilaginibacter pedocola]